MFLYVYRRTTNDNDDDDDDERAENQWFFLKIVKSFRRRNSVALARWAATEIWRRHRKLIEYDTADLGPDLQKIVRSILRLS